MRSGAQSVLGRYRLGEIIGAGGMGTVLRAHDEVLGREVAVKLLREELAADERSLARFRQEARIAASLSHPGIAAVYDFAEEEGRPAIVMELLDGKDLHTILQREGPMDGARVAALLAEAADALAYAHALGAVHRDVKPANIFLTSSGAVKITDFGVAYAAGGGQLTTTGALIGTPDYLSPEQVRGERATAASDVYSLGCVAFQLVTGRTPFAGDNSIAVATSRLDAPAPSARAVNPQVPPQLDAVIRRALEPALADRYPSAAAMAKALRSAARTAAPTYPAPGEPTPPMGTAALGAGPAAAGPGTVVMDAGPPTMVEGAGFPAVAPEPPPVLPPMPPPVMPPLAPPRERAPRRGRFAWLWVALLVVFVAGLSFDIVRSWEGLNAPKVVPAWTNLSYDQAAAAAHRLGFAVRRADADSQAAGGQVIATAPPAGGTLRRGGTVTLTVSRGNLLAVPDVSNMSVADATSALAAKGFHAVVSQQTVPGAADGQVASQVPAANAVVPKGDVTLTVTAVPTDNSGDQNSGDNSAAATPSVLCSLLNIGCTTAAPTPSPTAHHKKGNG